MTTRTFRQRGQAFGSSPVTITAKLDGVEIFNGTTPTLNEPFKLTGFDPDSNALDLGEVLFSWTGDSTFSGTKALEITVGSGFLVLMNTSANHPPYIMLDDPENEWAPVYYTQIDDVAYTNPWSNMIIDGKPQHPNNDIPGQTYWLVPPGSTMTVDLNVTASKVKIPGPPTPG